MITYKYQKKRTFVLRQERKVQTMSIYGYCRISTKKQSIERQIRNILAVYPEAKLYTEAFTGTKVDGRKEFIKLLNVVTAGDTIVFDSVSRMSRNAEEGFNLYQKLFAEGINLVFLKESYINTDTYKEAIDRQLVSVSTGDEATDELVQSMMTAINRYMMKLAEKQIVIAFEQSEKEVTDLHQRTKEGLETARKDGKQIGLKEGTKLTTKKSVTAKAEIQKYSVKFGGTLNDTEVMKLTGLARNTYYKYCRELIAELNEQ